MSPGTLQGVPKLKLLAGANRLLLALANGMGHHIGRFGNPNLCGDGVLSGLS